jgi:hypothetical protein
LISSAVVMPNSPLNVVQIISAKVGLASGCWRPDGTALPIAGEFGTTPVSVLTSDLPERFRPGHLDSQATRRATLGLASRASARAVSTLRRLMDKLATMLISRGFIMWVNARELDQKSTDAEHYRERAEDEDDHSGFRREASSNAMTLVSPGEGGLSRAERSASKRLNRYCLPPSPWRVSHRGTPRQATLARP